VVESCSQTAKFLDISAKNATELQTSLFDVSQKLMARDGNGNKVSFRLRTTNSPVQCGLQQGIREELDAAHQRQSSPVLEYQCYCSQGYFLGKDDLWQLVWDAGRIATLAFGCTVLVVFSTLVAALVCLCLRSAEGPWP